MADLVLSVMMLGCLLLLAGGVLLWRKGQRKQAVLMGILAAVIAVNIGIWTVPTQDSRPLTETAPR